MSNTSNDGRNPQPAYTRFLFIPGFAKSATASLAHWFVENRLCEYLVDGEKEPYAYSRTDFGSFSLNMARSLIGPDFFGVYLDAPLEVCEARGPKGLYRKARSGQLANMTGIHSPYEIPEHPDLPRLRFF